MTLRRIIKLNALLVTLVGVYGLVTDEPYWREVGHGPWTYDYLFWIALVLNGPSGYLADWSSWKLGLYMDSGFLAQYAFWLMLLAVQWVLYANLARWAAVTRTRRFFIYGVSLALFLTGCATIAHIWQLNLKRDAIDEHINVFFWPAGIGGLMLAGLWVSLLTFGQEDTAAPA
jgi:hypothetical protein